VEIYDGFRDKDNGEMRNDQSVPFFFISRCFSIKEFTKNLVNKPEGLTPAATAAM